MKSKFILLFAALIFSLDAFAHSFNCPISKIHLGSGAPELVAIEMACPASNPIQSGTNGCTAETVSQNIVTFTTSNELGKNYYSLLLAAMFAGSNVYISAFGTCPSNSPGTPLIYSIRVDA